MNTQPKIESWMDSTTRKGTNFNFTPRLYKVTIVKWISFMAFDGKHFFLSNVLMRKCWVLIMASSCWWPILRFILVVRFNLVCLDLTELMNCVLRWRFVKFPLHDLKGIDLMKTLFFLSNVLIGKFWVLIMALNWYWVQLWRIRWFVS